MPGRLGRAGVDPEQTRRGGARRRRARRRPRPRAPSAGRPSTARSASRRAVRWTAGCWPDRGRGTTAAADDQAPLGAGGRRRGLGRRDGERDPLQLRSRSPCRPSARRSDTTASTNPSTTAWTARRVRRLRRYRRATSPASPASLRCEPGPRRPCASVAAVSSAGLPTPTAMTWGPAADGTVSVWPTLPSNPWAVSAARVEPEPTGHRAFARVRGCRWPRRNGASCGRCRRRWS